MTREVTLQDINGNYITLVVPESGNANFYDLPVATTSSTGVVKPDGTSITVTSAGVISATATGTVTSVNNVSPVNGNVTLTIPTVPTNLSSFTDDLGSSPTHTHSQYLTSHQDISGKEDVAKAMNVLATSGTIVLTDNSVNTITPSAAVTFTLPTVTDNTKYHWIYVQIKLSTVYTINLGLGGSYYITSDAPDLSTTGVYDLFYEYDTSNQRWRAGAIKGS